MANSGDLIDFEIIETQKENIQSLPSGRSAKALAAVFSPIATKSPSLTQDINATARQEFEKELLTIDESDDPLDIYDRYVKWTLEAYPSAQATAQSQLLPLLERATKTFLASEHYKNDSRYLKLWLFYIQLFAEVPRETFVYLARHSVGESLALYYEEFAAWLESAGRWSQAEEIYRLGIDKAARPTERLARKYREFEARLQVRPQDVQEPSSPALPVVRAALAAKVDPFAAAAPTPIDPQAASRSTSTIPRSRRQKLEIFSDTDEKVTPVFGSASKGWDNIGTVAERKKENTMSAKPWAGETLSGTVKTNLGMPKMMVFKDESQQAIPPLPSSPLQTGTHPSNDQRVVNPRTGKIERVFVDLEAVYPEPNNPAAEFCFEELRAGMRGWLQRDWKAEREVAKHKSEHPPLIISDSFSIVVEPMPPLDLKQVTRAALQSIPVEMLNDQKELVRSKVKTQSKMTILKDEDDENRPPVKTAKMLPCKDEDAENVPPSKVGKLMPVNDENDENAPPSRAAQEREIARRIRREERANKTRKIKVGKSKSETTTIQTNLSSPKGPKIRPKRNREPTMTLHSKVAMDEVYDLFNQPLKAAEEEAEGSESESDEESDDDIDDDEYTSGAESTTTGRMSGPSECGEDSDEEDVTQGQNLTVQQEATADNTRLSDFSPVKIARHGDLQPEQLVSEPEKDEAQTSNDREQIEEEVREESHEVTTPISPVLFVPALEHIPVYVDEERRANPYRTAAQAAQSRLPFMTPIVERTESSLGTATTRHEKDYFNSKTPCPRTTHKTPTITEGDELWSSPFEEVLKEAISERNKIAKPNLTKAKANVLVKTNSRQAKLSSGPIIGDAQCNPMDDAIHQTILSEMEVPLSSYEGFFQHSDTTYARKTDIRKYCKSITSAKANKPDSTIAPLALSFPSAEYSYTVHRELGSGAYAPIYLVSHPVSLPTTSNSIMGRGSFAGKPARASLEALKLESPSSAWEFHMLRLTARRLSLSRAAASIISAHELHLFNDESYLIESFRPQGTLLDLVNATASDRDGAHGLGGTASSSQTDGLDEPLAMFFAVELLRTLEALHAKGIVHADLKADNVLVRLGPAALESSYAPSGDAGWSAKGLCLIDFGRAIDMRSFRHDVGFVADWPTGATDCAEMRECRPWTYQADYHGAAAVMHTMLFGRYIETVVDKVASQGLGPRGKVWKLKEGLKRYWQGEIWQEAFALLLNPAGMAEGEEGGKMPCLLGLRRVRERMETWLEANGERGGVGLKARLVRVEAYVNGSRRR